MRYVDTSVIVKLYIKENLSLEVSNWIRSQKGAIPLTAFHELEFKNALYLKQFRAEISEVQIQQVLSKFEDYQNREIYYRPPVDWANTMVLAIDLSRDHTQKTGARSLDILHVATALALKAERFVTLDERQATVAGLAGLKLEDCTDAP